MFFSFLRWFRLFSVVKQSLYSGLKILDRVFDNESKESKEENKQNTEIESKGLSQKKEVKPKEQTQDQHLIVLFYIIDLIM